MILWVRHILFVNDARLDVTVELLYSTAVVSHFYVTLPVAHPVTDFKLNATRTHVIEYMAHIVKGQRQM